MNTPFDAMSYREFLKPDEERALQKSNKPEDRIKLLDSHLPQILAIVSKFTCYERDRDLFGDLVQEGYLGLEKAVDKWDANKGSLKTTVHWYARARILRYLEEGLGDVQIPISTVNGRRERGVDIGRPQCSSINGAPDDFQWVSTRGGRPDDIAEWKSVCVLLGEAFLSIPKETQREAILLRYVEGLKLAEIGKRQNRTAEAVRLRLKEGLKYMRVYMQDRGYNSAAELLESKEIEVLAWIPHEEA